MSRTALTAQAAPGPYAAAGIALSLQAADSGNGNTVPSSGRDLLFVMNSDVGAQTVTVASSPDEKGRLGDITAESIGAGAIHIFGPLPALGWKQTNGNLNIDSSDPTIKVATLQL